MSTAVSPIKAPPRPAILRVLGIDPGIKAHGFCVLDVDRQGKAKWVVSGHDEKDPAELLRQVGQIDLLAVEMPATVHRAEATPSIVRTADSAGQFLGAADEARIATAKMAPARWRALVCGKAGPSDAEVKRSILFWIKTWPARSRNHERDAAGVALACARSWPTCLRKFPGPTF